ncbi:P27 family phage terminase small subunit [Rhizobium pusense]|uniref:P27 family phage terminase small subunit n=1 Tax=Agrobacterium pusense TaxID=648995 RepID=UPI002447B005|nr:P27 family phage terminase small subunit [Agrobacterium pusense]MDH2091124.1 P27 family phage terminase small subunit [Agrobacterium pusense]
MARGPKAGISRPSNPMTEIPPPPSILDKDARKVWKEIMPDLVERKILTAADMPQLRSFCMACGKVEKLERAIQADPGFDPALYRAQDKAMTTARQIGDQYGLAPTSRSKPAIRDADDDDNEAILD